MSHCETPGRARSTRPDGPAGEGEGENDGSRSGTIVLAGNPNVGKSVVFNSLTGSYVTVSNFPGTTVEVLHGKLGDRDVVDTPGVYGVSSFNDEEIVARDVILEAGTVVDVVDAAHLERDLFLTLQLIDMGLPVLVVLNMVDEARRHGVVIDVDLLSDLLGVPVVETVAVTGEGMDRLEPCLAEAMTGHWGHAFEDEMRELEEDTGSRPDALMVLEGDAEVAARHGLEPRGLRAESYRERRERVDDIIGHVVRHTTSGASFTTRLSHWMMNPLTGIPMLLAVLYGVYKLLGEFVAGVIVDFLESEIMLAHFVPAVQDLFGSLLGEGGFPYAVLAGEFGVLTLTPTYLLAVILPLVSGFYLVMSLLEDTGYLPRIAALTDRALSGIGLNGRAVIPLILGFGCVTMGTLTTRILGSRRERIIATALMAIAVPCSAQIAVIAALMGKVGARYSLAYVGVVGVVFVMVGTVLARITPGTTTDLLIDLPQLRVPRLGNVLRKTGFKVWHFMKEVALFFAAGALIISTLEVSGALAWIQDAAAPLVVSWLHLPQEAATAFVMGFVRRDFGATGFFLMDLDPLQLLVGMVTITLFVPCIASMMVILKERGLRYLLFLLVASVGTAFLVGGLLTRALELVA